MDSIGFKQEKTIIFTDSSTSIDIASSLRQMKKRSSHWTPKLFLIKDGIKTGQVQLVKIPTADNPADALTKPLAEQTFEKHLKSSGFVRSLKEGVEGGLQNSCTPGSRSRSILNNSATEEILSSVEPANRKPRGDKRGNQGKTSALRSTGRCTGTRDKAESHVPEA